MFNQTNHTIEFSERQLDDFFNPIITQFNNSPLISLSNLPTFAGSGVYGIFLTEDSNTIYNGFVQCQHPIYVGKATQKGGRQGQAPASTQRALRSRLMKHRRSIEQVNNLSTTDFMVKFLIVNGRASTLISAMEGYLIREMKPIWNSFIDGFGINAPGAGRYNQSPSEWDTLHSGRYYAQQLTGEPRDFDTVMQKLKMYRASKEN